MMIFGLESIAKISDDYVMLNRNVNNLSNFKIFPVTLAPKTPTVKRQLFRNFEMAERLKMNMYKVSKFQKK